MSCAPSGTFETMDEELAQLLTAAQRNAPQTEGWHLALTRLVEAILRSRKVGRPPVGQPLSGIYQEIYERVRQQLLYDIGDELNHYNPARIPVREWASTLQHQAFRTILDDAQLKKLAIQAQCHPPQSEVRQHALGELVEAIRLSGRLGHPHRASFSPQFYDLLHDEAVNKTLTYVCRKIDNYDPDRGDKKFMNWVNFRLGRVINESCCEFREPDTRDLPSLAELENMVQPTEPPSLLESVRECIAEDVGDIFKRAFIRNRPDASFQAIALARLSGKTWEELSAKFRIPLPTLSRFFQRCCVKFRPQLRRQLPEFQGSCHPGGYSYKQQ